MLKIKGLYKSFVDKAVIEDFTADFSEGSRTVITGRSGVGKTTLLRIIAGLEVPDRGTVDRGNADVSYMFQEPRLFPWMSVYDNISAVTGKSDEDKIHKILSQLDLGEEERAMPYELSGGMQRRVSLARTLLFPADIYLFDEPFAGLDHENSINAANIIFEYTKNKTVIIVSHETQMLDDSVTRIRL